MFSLGCLVYALFNGWKSPLECNQDKRMYQSKISSIEAPNLSKIPPACHGNSSNFQPRTLYQPKGNRKEWMLKLFDIELIRRTLTFNETARMNASEFQYHNYFDSMLMQTVKYLDLIAEKTQANKSQFFKGLPNVLGDFPRRVLIRKVSFPAKGQAISWANLMNLFLSSSFFLSCSMKWKIITWSLSSFQMFFWLAKTCQQKNSLPKCFPDSNQSSQLRSLASWYLLWRRWIFF